MTETDEAFANVYSAAVSLQNLAPRAPQPLLIGLVTAIATAGALVIDLVSYQSFLFLSARSSSRSSPCCSPTGSPPAATTRARTFFEAPAWRPGLIAAWLAGFALYQWLFPTGPAWWTDLVAKLNPPDWAIGATVPSFLAAFVVASIVAVLSRSSRPGCAPHDRDRRPRPPGARRGRRRRA